MHWVRASEANGVSLVLLLLLLPPPPPPLLCSLLTVSLSVGKRAAQDKLFLCASLQSPASIAVDDPVRSFRLCALFLETVYRWGASASLEELVLMLKFLVENKCSICAN